MADGAALAIVLTPLLSASWLLVGVCGDPFQHHDNPSYYATMTNLPNQANYTAGTTVTLTWDITVNHGGRIGFKICARRTNLTQACFDRNPLFRCGALNSADMCPHACYSIATAANQLQLTEHVEPYKTRTHTSRMLCDFAGLTTPASATSTSWEAHPWAHSGK